MKNRVDSATLGDLQTIHNLPNSLQYEVGSVLLGRQFLRDPLTHSDLSIRLETKIYPIPDLKLAVRVTYIIDKFHSVLGSQ